MTHQNGDSARHFNTRGSGAHEDEREKVAMAGWVFFGLGLLKRLQDLVSNGDGIGEAFEAGRENFANSSCPK